jgi:2-phosphoglycerate kinase
MNSVYIISGPAGIGKSTISKELVKSLRKSSYISGDFVSHIPVNGRGKPWLSRETHNLTWDNIEAITRNLLKYGFDVVIDYVTFPKDVIWISKKLADLSVKIKYILLLADEDTLVARDESRPEETRMGERSVILLHEFLEKRIPDKYILDTSKLNVEMINKIIIDIKENPRYIFNGFKEE